MKKHLSVIFIILMIFALAFALVACDPDNGGDDPDPETPNEYENTTFTVTFDSDGGTSFDDFNLTDVVYGSTISVPTDSEGNEVMPIKKGYTFNYWALSDSTTTEFDFETETITADITLEAQYTANTYTHTYELYEPTDETTYKNYVTITDGSVLASTYSSSADTFTCPTTTISDDYFVYWYYYDSDGEQVRFTAWAKDPTDSDYQTTVAALTTYSFDSGLTLYAMWHSKLPTVSVSYKDSLSEGVYNTIDYKYNDIILAAEAANKLTGNTVSKSGYEFDGWYYITLDDDDEEVLTDFAFSSDDEDDPTYLTTDILTEVDDSDDYTIILYARWIRLVTISTASEFETYYNSIKSESTSDEDMEELLNAHIIIANGFDLSGKTFEMLFDADHVFEGIIDGGIYDADDVLDGTVTITGGTFTGTEYVSIFGYSNGTIKNLDIVNPTLVIEHSDSYARTIYCSPLLSINEGSVLNCTVTITSALTLASDNQIIFGGITAKSDGGEITNCETVLSNITVSAEGLTFGGISGVSNSTTITSSTATVKLVSVTTDNEDGSNGLSYAYIGGIAGENKVSVIQLCSSVFEATATADRTSYIGGLTGLNNIAASISKSKSTATISVSGCTVSAGGIAGFNYGLIINSTAANTITCTASVSAKVGGLTGTCYNNTNISTNGKIAYSYSTGTISATASTKTANVYMGGLFGYGYKCVISNVFTLVDITAATTQEEDEVIPSLGYLVGYYDSTSSFTNAFYTTEVGLSLNGTDAQDEGASLTLTDEGTSATIANFKSATWMASNLDNGTTKSGFNSTTIWTITDGSLPILII